MVVVEEETQFAPSKYWLEVQLAALWHFAESGMPKSGLVELPAFADQILALEETLLQACFNWSILD